MTGNPIIRHKFTADPTALVHNGKVYLYTGHDEAPPGKHDYVMNDWCCFSSPDLQEWTEHPHPLKATDFGWASGDAYASKIVHHRGKFYWFVAVTHATIPGKAIGVAVSENPEGPFTDALGKALITHDMLPATDNEKANLDPTVIVDENGDAWILWGNGTCYYARLKEDFSALEGAVRVLDLPGFTEGANLHFANGWYYLSYGYEMPEKVAYAMSRSVEGPWEFKGILNGLAENCETNRPCMVNFKGKDYFFYHNGALPGGDSHHRSVCVDELHYLEDNSLQQVVMTADGITAV